VTARRWDHLAASRNVAGSQPLPPVPQIDNGAQQFSVGAPERVRGDTSLHRPLASGGAVDAAFSEALTHR